MSMASFTFGRELSSVVDCDEDRLEELEPDPKDCFILNVSNTRVGQLRRGVRSNCC